MDDGRPPFYSPDDVTSGYTIRRAAQCAAAKLAEAPDDHARLALLDGLVAVAREVPFFVELSRVQNTYFELMSAHLPAVKQRAESGDEAARDWVRVFTELGVRLRVRVPG